MSTLCFERGWGIGLTASIGTPHPWLQCLNRVSEVGQVVPYLRQRCLQDIRRVAALPADWDGAGSEKPRASSVANASARLTELCNMAMVVGKWQAPHVSASESGEVTFEWWQDERKLTLYFGDDHIEALRVWGTHIEDEMDQFRVSRTVELAPAWAWLNGN